VSAEIEYRRGYPVLVNWPEPTRFAGETALALEGAERCNVSAAASTASDDFAFMLEKVLGSACASSSLMLSNIDCSRRSTISSERLSNALPRGVTCSWTVRRFVGSSLRIAQLLDSIVLTTSLADSGLMNERSASCAFDQRPRALNTNSAVNCDNVRP
jgi:hypothetical protein